MVRVNDKLILVQLNLSLYILYYIYIIISFIYPHKYTKKIKRLYNN